MTGFWSHPLPKLCFLLLARPISASLPLTAWADSWLIMLTWKGRWGRVVFFWKEVWGWTLKLGKKISGIPKIPGRASFWFVFLSPSVLSWLIFFFGRLFFFVEIKKLKKTREVNRWMFSIWARCKPFSCFWMCRRWAMPLPDTTTQWRLGRPVFLVVSVAVFGWRAASSEWFGCHWLLKCVLKIRFFTPPPPINSPIWDLDFRFGNCYGILRFLRYA